ncbi:MAG TPA: ABC transporter substrate-binding protein [Chloroflexota bacterium]
MLALALVGCTGARVPAAAPAAQAAPDGPVVRAPTATAPPTEAAPVHVTGGLVASVAGAPVLAGVDLGLYQRNGLDVSIETFTATPQIMTAIAAGQLDFGQVTMGAAAFNAYHRGVDLTIIAAGSGGAVPLVVRKDLWDSSAVRAVADLRDRTVALNATGNILEYSLHKVLERGNLTAADLHIVFMPFPEMVAALQNEAIDAAMMLEPAASTAVARGAGVILEEQVGSSPSENPWYAPGLQAGMLMANKQWAADHPDATVALIKSYLQTVRRVQGTRIHNDAEALASIERWTKVKPEIVKQATVTYWAPNGRLDTATLMDEQRFYIAAGSTDYKEPISISAVYSGQYLEAALEQIGTVPETE